MREWYVIISRDIFNPMYALFTVSPGDRVTYMINSASHYNPNHLCYYKFVGRVIGKLLDVLNILRKFNIFFQLKQYMTINYWSAISRDHFTNTFWVFQLSIQIWKVKITVFIEVWCI